MKKLLILLLFFASPAAAQKLSLNEISAYLNGLKSAQGGFTQINGDGSISTGTLLLKRPGRIRFEYNPPEKSLVMASGGQVAVFDAKSNDGPTRFPLRETPLSIILERNVDLARRNMVVGHVSDGTRTTVTAQDPDRPEYGFIQLVFTGTPGNVELRQWIVNDNGGNETTVILNDWAEGNRIRDIKFNIQSEMRKWGQ